MSARFKTDAVISEMKNVMRDSEQLLESIADKTSNEATELRRRLAETLESARVTCRNLEKRTRQNLAVVDDAICEHPYQSIAIAIVTGVAVGAIIARKKGPPCATQT